MAKSKNDPEPIPSVDRASRLAALEELRLETEEAELRLRLHKARTEMNTLRKSRRDSVETDRT